MFFFFNRLLHLKKIKRTLKGILFLLGQLIFLMKISVLVFVFVIVEKRVVGVSNWGKTVLWFRTGGSAHLSFEKRVRRKVEILNDVDIENRRVSLVRP